MEHLLVFKALSNETRRQILLWLRNPAEHFGRHYETDTQTKPGVCVKDIQEKAGLAQSVISSYLHTMQKAGLLESERVGQWTYYRRNEQTIREFAEYIEKEL
ncbi:ArsR/SmtB family transcription factor [Paenibacillus sepulcri]|uniref:Helix-turn-helix domain-containing protein n=1 Tax=Paenibacillus sepulcri TaxID=359917 RepID=A0ABS7CG67_9BACL|nr:helix-turn-helix domain-containing protein [Paenibacillus sepulcri]